jgi:hypothetical protein
MSGVVSAPSSQPLPTEHRVPRSRASELKLLLGWLALRDAMPTDALRVRQREEPLPAALCCTSEAQPGNQVSLSLAVPLSLSFPPLFPLLSTRETLSLPLTHNTYTNITMSTRSTRKRKNEEEELVELPEDSDAESEEE